VIWQVARVNGKEFLQGLKPIPFEVFTPGLEPRPSTEKKTSSPREGGELGAGQKLGLVEVCRVLIDEGLELLRQFFEHEN
jgi:hypothetical protein